MLRIIENVNHFVWMANKQWNNDTIPDCTLYCMTYYFAVRKNDWHFSDDDIASTLPANSVEPLY